MNTRALIFLLSMTAPVLHGQATDVATVGWVDSNIVASDDILANSPSLLTSQSIWAPRHLASMSVTRLAAWKFWSCPAGGTIAIFKRTALSNGGASTSYWEPQGGIDLGWLSILSSHAPDAGALLPENVRCLLLVGLNSAGNSKIAAVLTDLATRPSPACVFEFPVAAPAGWHFVRAGIIGTSLYTLSVNSSDQYRFDRYIDTNQDIAFDTRDPSWGLKGQGSLPLTSHLAPLVGFDLQLASPLSRHARKHAIKNTGGVLSLTEVLKPVQPIDLSLCVSPIGGARKLIVSSGPSHSILVETRAPGAASWQTLAAFTTQPGTVRSTTPLLSSALVAGNELRMRDLTAGFTTPTGIISSARPAVYRSSSFFVKSGGPFALLGVNLDQVTQATATADWLQSPLSIRISSRSSSDLLMTMPTFPQGGPLLIDLLLSGGGHVFVRTTARP